MVLLYKNRHNLQKSYYITFLHFSNCTKVCFKFGRNQQTVIIMYTKSHQRNTNTIHSDNTLTSIDANSC